MPSRAHSVRIDTTGAVHPVGRIASQELRARVGEWSVVPSPEDVILLRREQAPGRTRTLRLAGELRTHGALCDVVALVAQAAQSGELVVIEGDARRSLYFDSGTVAGARTNVDSERFGELLYRFGVITRAQLEDALAYTRASGKRMGEAAIELAFAAPEALYGMMSRQVEEVFYAALHVASGTFYFFDGYDESSLFRRHNLSAQALLMEGARRMDELRFFREKIPSSDCIPVPLAQLATTTRNPPRKPPDDLAEVYAACDGKATISEIGRAVGQLEFEITRAVFQLIGGGFLTVVAPRPAGAEAIVRAFNPAIAEIHRQCDAHGKGGELRDSLARFAVGGGVFDPLFQGAGPLVDGTLDPPRVARNLVALAGEDPDAWLVQQLYDYVGFALFQAGSLLPRDAERALSLHVAEALKGVRSVDNASPTSRKV